MSISNLFACVTEPIDQKHSRGMRNLIRWINLFPQGISARFPPVTVSSITGVKSSFGETAGFLISPNLGVRHYRELSRDFVIRKLTRTTDKAVRLGARIVGLPPTVSVAGGGGVLVARYCRAAVTTGRSLAVAAALEACRKALFLSGMNIEDSIVAVIDATEPAAAAAARHLARRGVNYLSLTSSDSYRLEALARAIIYESGVSCKISASVSRAVGRADLVIYGLGETALENLSSLKPGAIICSLDQTPGLAKLTRRLRNDLLVVEDVMFNLPGEVIFSHTPGPGIRANTASAWMAEAMILALEGRFESYSLGSVLRVDKIDEIWQLASRHGFVTAGKLNTRCLPEHGREKRISLQHMPFGH